MRTVLMLVVLLAGLIVGGWIGGETLLARSLREAIASDPRLGAGQVTQLREADRIGVRLRDFTAVTPEATLAADWVDLFLPPAAPGELHVMVAPGAALTGAGRELTLGASGAEAWVAFSPSHGFVLSDARLLVGDAALDGAPAVGRIDLAAELAPYGADAPRTTGAAYDIRLAVEGLSLAALSGGAVQGIAAAEGPGRLWLDRVPVRASGVMDAGGMPPAPQVVGLRLDGVNLALDDLGARLYGRVTADDEGLATGRLLIDTADTRAFVERAAAMGLLPQGATALAATVLNAVAQEPAEETPDAAAGLMPDWPAPREGEARLVLSFRDGQTFLGPLPLGPAPGLQQRP